MSREDWRMDPKFRTPRHRGLRDENGQPIPHAAHDLERPWANANIEHGDGTHKAWTLIVLVLIVVAAVIGSLTLLGVIKW